MNSMKKLLVLILLLTGTLISNAQTPTNFYHIPSNAGVNNLFFNSSVSGKIVFIYTQAELAAAGISGASGIGSIWFRHNQAMSGSLTNFEVTMGHSTLGVPITSFAGNFNSGSPQVVLSSASYNYSSVAGTWNVPANGWTEMQLTTPFAYNGVDNIAIQISFSSSSVPVPFYADNGGVPITQYANSNTATTASANTARPMMGFSPPPSTAPPVVSFESSDSVICQNECISFADLSAQFPTSWTWTFPGSVQGGASVQNPDTVCYMVPGNYDVKLVASNSFGSDSLTIPNMIIVKPASIASFSASGDSVCAGDSVSFVNTSTAGAISNTWTVNGSMAASTQDFVLNPVSSGSSTVVLTVESNSGCITSAEVEIHADSLPPVNTVTSDSIICIGETVTFAATPFLDYAWLLDGVNINVGTLTTVDFTTSGSFDVDLIATSGVCVDTIQLPLILVGDDPQPDFQMNETELCISDTLHLTNTSVSNANDFTWKINGAVVSNAQDYSTVLTNLGANTVRLVATDLGCVDSTEQVVIIEPEPIAIFSSSGTGQPWELTFMDQSVDASTFAWDFGDGNTSTAQNPTHSYATGGNYQVCLTVATDVGCEHTTCEVIDAPVGMADVWEEQSLQVYPNPFSEAVYLETELVEPLTVRWRDLTGRELRTVRLEPSASPQILTLEDAPAGVYFLEVTSGDTSSVVRIVKEEAR